MFKKLLTLAAFMAVGVGWGNLAHAQTDVTATYITNPGFEGDYTIKTTYQQGGSNERYIFEPDGWTVVHTNPNTNDLTCLKSSDKQSNSFSSYTMKHSGEQTYWARLRWGGQNWQSSGTTGSPTSIELQQQLTALPSGVYRLSADLLCYAGAEKNNHIYLKATSANNSWQVEPTINSEKSDNNWENKSLIITSDGCTEYTIGLQNLQNWNNNGETISGFDDVKLEKLSTSAAEPLDITSIVPKGTSNWTNHGANNAGSFSNGGVTMVERYYNQHYTGTVSELTVKDLPSGLYEAEVYCHAHCADWNCSAIPEAAGQTDRTILSANNVEYGIPIVNDKSLTEGPQVRLLENISVTDGTLVFKVRNDQEGANWLTFEVKSLKYFGPTIAAEAVEFTSGATMEADKWYYFDAPFATTYAFAAGTDLNNIDYTTDGSILLENALSVNNKFVASQDVEVKRYYFKSSEAQTFTFGPASYSYTVGDATSNIADGAYIQSLTTWTLEYASATSDDPDATFALVDGSAKAVLAKGGTPVAEGTLSLDGNTLTATFDGVTLDKESAYTLSLPAGVVGYEGQEANAAVSVAVNTPAVFDGHFYLYNTDTKTYLSRSGKYATQAILDNYGLAVILKTDATGKTTIQYFDSEYWLGDDGFCYGDCTGGRIRTYNVTKVEGGYKFLNTNNNMYLAVYNGAAVGDAVEGGNLQGTSNIWALESTADHVTNYTRNADAQVIAAVANVDELNSITTKAELESKLASDYQAIHIAITGAKEEKFNQYAGYSEALAENTYYSETVTGLAPGLYKLSVDAFQRAASNEKVRDADGARSIIYLYANGAKTQLKSVMDAYAETAYDEYDFVVDGKHYPDTQAAAYIALETVDYSNDVYVYVAADGESETGTLKIGIKNPTRLGGDFATWAVYNNWTLTYYKEAASIVSATGITIAPASATVTTGETVTLTATVTPEEADDKTASWSSSNEAVATVDNNGVVTALEPGSATITASANGGEDITASATITVADAAAPAFYATDIATATDYYIVNAATGKFLGGGNNYGTRASLIEHGIPFTITQEESGKYTLDSHVYNSKDSHYFRGDYVDQTSKNNIYITPIGESGKFSISTAEGAEYVTAAAGNTIVANNAADANSSLAQWYFVSKTDRDKALAAATDQNPVDATYYIPNASFSRNMNTQYNENPWSVDATNSNLNSETNCAESYHSTFEVKKTITNLPNGSYKVRAQAVANNAETGAVVFINEGEDGQTAAFDVMQNGETNMATCAASFAAGRYYTEWIPVTVENHTLTLGVKGGVVDASWCVWDNFELYMTGYTPVTEVTASIDNSEIEVSGTAQITASVTEGASFDAISYVSSDVTVATVDENGLVTAVAEGTANITVKAEMENESKTIDVTVIFTSATPDDYAALNAAMEGKILGFLEGEYAPYNNNVEGIEALNAAKAIDQTQKNSAEVVQSLTAAITNATWTANTEEVNAVYDGTFAAAENNGAPAGWTMSNNTLGGGTHARAFVGDDRLSEFNGTKSGFFLRFDGYDSSRGSLYHYGKTAGYTMPLKANTTYYVKANVAGWGSTGKPIRLNVSGPEDFTALNQQLNTNVRADIADNLPQTFYILFTTGETEGNYTISFQTPGSDDNKHNVVVSNIELKSSLDVTMTIKVDNEYGTFFAPFDVDIPQGVKAYMVESVNDKDELELIEVTSTIPANTPVIIYKNEFTAEEVANKVFTETFHGINLIANTETEGTNLLTGVYYRQLAPENSYVLQNIDEKVAFYHVEAGGQPTMRAYSAYLNYTEPNSAKSLSFGDDEATAIAGIEALTSGNMEGIYTTSGAKVNSLQKGVNIIRTKDGKSMKVYVK